MAGILYVTGTPIGNLSDMSARVRETFETVDFIAAEDTRVTLKLLNHLDIKKPLVSYYEHNRTESGARILERILAGESCALVSDAGMPAISDPGEDLVRICAEAGVEIVSVPGPSAVVSALSVSGLPSGRFTFEGFLSTSRKSRFEHLEELKTEQRTMIFYEAPHKLMQTLRDMLDAFGDRKISLSRELTKLHEQTLRTTISGAIAHFEETAPRGEFVLIIAGAEKTQEQAPTLDDALALLDRLISEGSSLKDAAREAAEATGIKKNAIYDAAVKRD